MTIQQILNETAVDAFLCCVPVVSAIREVAREMNHTITSDQIETALMYTQQEFSK